MKQLLSFAILAFFVTYIFESCKKSDKKVTLTTTQQVQAKWTLESLIDHEHVNSPVFDSTITTPGTAADYLDFRADGKVYSSLGGSLDTTTYAIVGDTSILIVSAGSYRIQTLTANAMKLYTKLDVPSWPGYIEEYINLKK